MTRGPERRRGLRTGFPRKDKKKGQKRNLPLPGGVDIGPHNFGWPHHGWPQSRPFSLPPFPPFPPFRPEPPPVPSACFPLILVYLLLSNFLRRFLLVQGQGARQSAGWIHLPSRDMGNRYMETGKCRGMPAETQLSLPCSYSSPPRFRSHAAPGPCSPTDSSPIKSVNCSVASTANTRWIQQQARREFGIRNLVSSYYAGR